MVNVTEEFLEFISEGALAIEVWGHRCTGNGTSVWEVDSLHAKTRTLRDRYKLLLDAFISFPEAFEYLWCTCHILMRQPLVFVGMSF